MVLPAGEARVAVNSFGRFLREARKQSSLTQAQVAKGLGVSMTYLSDIERGHRPPFPATDRDRYESLALMLGVSCDEILARAALERSNSAIEGLPEHVRDLVRYIVQHGHEITPGQVLLAQEALDVP